MKTETKYLFQDLCWFEKNAFMDQDGDFWKTEEGREDYLRNVDSGGHARDLTKKDQIVFTDDIGMVINEESMPMEDCQWGVKKVLTKETHPEYWL